MTKLTAIHNIAPTNVGAELARLAKEVARMEGIVARLTPQRITAAVNTLLRPAFAELALIEKEQAAEAHAAKFNDFSGFDLNAMMEEGQ